jgi:pilus assembly protein Flp/PilA
MHALCQGDFSPPSRGTHFSPLEVLVMKLLNSVKTFLKSEDGPTAVEYAVMLALIVIVCLTAIQAIGTNANVTFNSVATKLGAGAAS